MVDLKRLAFDKGLGQMELGSILDIAQSQVSLMINGRRDIKQEHIDKLIAKFGKEVVDAYVINEELYETFSTPQTKQVQASIFPAEVVEEIKAEVVEEIEKEIVVPIVPHIVATQAETDIKQFIKENAEELEHFDPRTITTSVDGAERICSTSMLPTFQPHDIVFVRFLKDKTRITDGKLYYFDTKKWPTMIRLVKMMSDGRLLLKALNPRFGDLIVTFDDIINIGRITGMYRETFGDQYAEIEEVRRRKDAQVDKLVEQNGEALKIIHDLIKK